jgi:catechol 2,3-dioxygenase-like lactoylglutathione lyase family enzyme
MQMKLELVSVPVSDVDKAKDFYTEKLGFHADNDNKISEKLRFVQLTPPGSGCSIVIGVGITKMKPGTLDSLLLVVDDIEKAHDELVKNGVAVTDVKKEFWGAYHIYFSDPDGNKWQIQQPASKK